jgi:hypothetical protein
MCAAAIGSIQLPPNLLSLEEQKKERAVVKKLVNTLASFTESTEPESTMPITAREVIVLSTWHPWAIKDLTFLRSSGATNILASHTVQYITEDDDLLVKVKNLLKNPQGEMTKGAVLFLFGAPGEDGLASKLATEIDQPPAEVIAYLRKLFS